MPKKKQILFIMNNLHVGGAEKALVSLLQFFDYDKYDVDLLLFKQEGLFLKDVPSGVNLLPMPENYNCFDGPIKNALLYSIKRFNFRLFTDRILFGFLQKKKISAAAKEQRAWKYIKKNLHALKKEYDVAIGFLEKTPNYFCVDKVHARKKIGYIHTDYSKLGLEKNFDIYYFKKLDKIITVSAESCDVLKKVFPFAFEKFHVIENIVRQEEVLNRSFENISKLPSNTIISVGRLIPSKGYDQSLEAFKILKERNVDFRWIILGDGPSYSVIKKKIKSFDLTENVKLLGSVHNPYPYFRNAHYFLHASHYEGDGIVVREAKLFCKPIVVTNFNTASSLIRHGKTGLISDMDALSIADSVEHLLLNPDICKTFSENLAIENELLSSEISKFYELLES